MNLRIGHDGSYIEADAAGIDFLLSGLHTLRDSEPGTVVSAPSLINGEDPAIGPFRLVRVEEGP